MISIIISSYQDKFYSALEKNIKDSKKQLAKEGSKIIDSENKEHIYTAKDGNKNKLREEDIANIISAYESFEDKEKYAKVVDIEDIRKNDYNLNITRYVDTSEEEEEIDIEEVLGRISEREQELADSKEKINGFLEKLGFEKV